MCYVCAIPALIHQMKEIENIIIRSNKDHTAVVLHARKRILHFEGTEPETLKLAPASITVNYDDGSKFAFYIEEDTLIQFIRESFNAQTFKSTSGEIGGKI